MSLNEVWFKAWIYLGFVCGWTGSVRPQFDTSTDMGLVLVPMDAEIDSVIFRLRATDQDADFPLMFEITAAVMPIVRVENLPCTLYNKVCQANVVLTKRLVPGRLHDFAVRVRDSKGDTNSMQATISVTNATTPRDKIFPHIPSLIMVPEDSKPGKELDYLLVRSNPWSGKPVYIELWQPKELFTIRQRQTPTQTRGVIVLIGELDFETQSMYTLTMYATDPYTEPGKDTRNIAGLHVVVVVRDVQDVPPVFTIAPPLTKINNSIQPGDIILRVHAEDGDKGAPRNITYGLVSEGNPFVSFFNISETTGEIILARPLNELTQITHVGAPVVLSVVAEEIRRFREEAPAQATVVELGFLLGEPGNRPPYFENDNYTAWMDENEEPGFMVMFAEPYSTKVKDEDIGKAGVFTLQLNNNNGTFEINPMVAERTANFIITVRDNTLIDYEAYKNLRFKIIAQEVGPMTNLSATVPVTIFLRDVNDNPPKFDQEIYEVSLSENVTVGMKVIQVYATDKDTGLFGSVQYTQISGSGNEAFLIDSETGLITVGVGAAGLDREVTSKLQLSVEARDENGKGLKGTVPLIVNLLDVNDNAPVFVKDNYEFTLNSDFTNITTPANIMATDADAEPPNNEIRYELIHGNYENKFHLNEVTGELTLREPLDKIRRARSGAYQHFAAKFKKGFLQVQQTFQKMIETSKTITTAEKLSAIVYQKNRTRRQVEKIWKYRKKRDNSDALYTLTARAYDLGVPHLSSTTQIRIISGAVARAQTVMFVVPGEHPDPIRTAETLAAITGGRVTIQEIRQYVSQNRSKVTENGLSGVEGGKKSIVVARVEHTPGTSLVDVERIRETLAVNGVGIIDGMDTDNGMKVNNDGDASGSTGVGANSNNVNKSIVSVHSEEVTVYRAENKLLFWLLVLLGVLMVLAVVALILCCICPGCPFYMTPRKRRVRSCETIIVHSDERSKRHLHRKPAKVMEVIWPEKKQAWSADPTKRNWQFNRRNTNNRGLTSLPGDLANVPPQNIEIPPNAASLRLRDGPVPSYVRNPIQRHEEERIYIEDVEGQGGRCYDLADMDSLRRHEMERDSDIRHPGYRYGEQRPSDETTRFVREQHFYRDGNAEVLRLITRGQLGEDVVTQVPMNVTLDQQSNVYRGDGKNILLQRFIEDQKIKHVQDLREKEIRGDEMRHVGHHQYPKETMVQQQEIILLPDQLHRENVQHFAELTPEVQRLIIDRGDLNETRKEELEESKGREVHRQQQVELTTEAAMIVGGAITKAVEKPSLKNKAQSTQSLQFQPYSIHEVELARQNALLAQLLLERESKGVGAVLDTASFLETQSLPGQIATATQTDRTAGTQTEYFVKSRSDNDESEEEIKLKRRLKFKKRYEDGEVKRMKTLWMKSPIEEEDQSFTETRLSALRRKIRETREGRKAMLEPHVLREISDSLDENGSSLREDEPIRLHRYITRDVTFMRHGALDEEDQSRTPSSPETDRDRYRKKFNDTKERMRETSVDDIETEGSPRKQVAPSFRILEKDFTSSKKQPHKAQDKRLLDNDDVRKLDKRSILKEYQEKNVYKSIVGSDSRNRNVGSKRSKRKDFKVDQSKGVPEQSSFEVISTDEVFKLQPDKGAKVKKMLKYQQSQMISTESLEFEDAFDKPRKKKHSAEIIQAMSQKQQLDTSKYEDKKRESRVNTKKYKTEDSFPHAVETEKRKESSSQETSKSYSDSGGHIKDLVLVHNRNNAKSKVVRSHGTGTNLDRADSKKKRTEIQQNVDKSITNVPKKELEVSKSDVKSGIPRHVNIDDSKKEINGKEGEKEYQSDCGVSSEDTFTEKSLESSNGNLEYEKRETPTRQSSEGQLSKLTKSSDTIIDNEEPISRTLEEIELDRKTTEETLENLLADKIIDDIKKLKIDHYSETDDVNTSKEIDVKSETLNSEQTDKHSEPHKKNAEVEISNGKSDKEMNSQEETEGTIKAPISSKNIQQDELTSPTKSFESSTSKDDDILEKDSRSTEKINEIKDDDKKQSSTEIQYQRLQNSSSNSEGNMEANNVSVPKNENHQTYTQPMKPDKNNETDEHPCTVPEDEIDNKTEKQSLKMTETNESNENKSVLREKSTPTYDDDDSKKIESSRHVPIDVDASSDRNILEEKMIPEEKEIPSQTSFLTTDFNSSDSIKLQSDEINLSFADEETHLHGDFLRTDENLDSANGVVGSKVEDKKLWTHSCSPSSKDVIENPCDSDSSSNSSSKTTLHAEPYQTPRRRLQNLPQGKNMESGDIENLGILEHLTVPRKNIEYKLQDIVSSETISNEDKIESETDSSIRQLLENAAQPITLSEIINEKKIITPNKDVDKQEHLEQNSTVKSDLEECDVTKKPDLEQNNKTDKKESELKHTGEIFESLDNISLPLEKPKNVDNIGDIKEIPQNREDTKSHVDRRKVDKKVNSAFQEEAKLALKRKPVHKDEKYKGRISPQIDLEKHNLEVRKTGNLLKRKGQDKISEKISDENKTKKPHISLVSSTKNFKRMQRSNEKESKQMSNKAKLHPHEQSRKASETEDKQVQRTKLRIERNVPSDTAEKTMSLLKRKEQGNVSKKPLEENKANEPRISLISSMKVKRTQRSNEKKLKQASNKNELDSHKQSKKTNETDDKQAQRTKSKIDKNVFSDSKGKTSNLLKRKEQENISKKVSEENKANEPDISLISSLKDFKRVQKSNELDSHKQFKKASGTENKQAQQTNKNVPSDNTEKASSLLKKKEQGNISEEASQENKTNEPHIPLISPTKDLKYIKGSNKNESRQIINKDELDLHKQLKKASEPDDKQAQQTEPKTEKNVLNDITEKTPNLLKTDDVSNVEAESNTNQSQYMSRYKKKREEMERKRREKKEAEEEEQRPRWIRRSTIKKSPQQVRIKKKIRALSLRTSRITLRSRHKVKPLVNVESEQLKAIVRQGRKLRKAEGAQNEDPPVEIFAPEKPPPPIFSTTSTKYRPSNYRLEYVYETIPTPFYLHPPPPPVPHSSPQFSPEHFQPQFSESKRPDDDLDSGIAVSLQGGIRFHHEELVEKRSVFDIAYTEATPSKRPPNRANRSS